jgi:hypothetical protein
MLDAVVNGLAEKVGYKFNLPRPLYRRIEKVRRKGQKKRTKEQ